jgi:hypothetical protein
LGWRRVEVVPVVTVTVNENLMDFLWDSCVGHLMIAEPGDV